MNPVNPATPWAPGPCLASAPVDVANEQWPAPRSHDAASHRSHQCAKPDQTHIGLHNCRVCGRDFLTRASWPGYHTDPDGTPTAPPARHERTADLSAATEQFRPATARLMRLVRVGRLGPQLPSQADVTQWAAQVQAMRRLLLDYGARISVLEARRGHLIGDACQLIGDAISVLDDRDGVRVDAMRIASARMKLGMALRALDGGEQHGV